MPSMDIHIRIKGLFQEHRSQLRVMLVIQDILLTAHNRVRQNNMLQNEQKMKITFMYIYLDVSSFTLKFTYLVSSIHLSRIVYYDFCNVVPHFRSVLSSTQKNLKWLEPIQGYRVSPGSPQEGQASKIDLISTNQNDKSTYKTLVSKQ